MKMFSRFKLICCLAVLSVGGFLASFLVPASEQARRRALMVHSSSNVRQHTGEHCPVYYRRELTVCPFCTDKRPDGSPRRITVKRDVVWHTSWGRLPSSTTRTFYNWPPSADRSGDYRGQSYAWGAWSMVMLPQE